MRDRRGRDSMVVGFAATYAISAYHHWNCGFKSRSGRGVLDTTLCDKVCQWLVTDRWFSTDPPVSSTNKTDRNDIREILLKVALNTIKQANKQTNIILCALNLWIQNCTVFLNWFSTLFYIIYRYIESTGRKWSVYSRDIVVSNWLTYSYVCSNIYYLFS